LQKGEVVMKSVAFSLLFLSVAAQATQVVTLKTGENLTLEYIHEPTVFQCKSQNPNADWCKISTCWEQGHPFGIVDKNGNRLLAGQCFRTHAEVLQGLQVLREFGQCL